MTAAELNAEADVLERETALVTAVTAQQQLRGAVAAADIAYTDAVRAAVQGSGDWAAVQVAGNVFKQCRAAIKEGL
jgi:hypothetical protein